MSIQKTCLCLTITVLFLLQKVSSEAINVRLAGGDGRTTGRVEVSVNNTVWGSVCDDMWTDREAQVVCRQLHFRWGTAYSSAAFGEGDGPIFLDNVQCTNTERSLGECQHNGWGNHNCRHYEDAGVACYNRSVRLKSRGRTDVGTVEIRHEDKWVEVCDEDWEDVDARVLCREMGYRDGKALHHSTLGELQSSSTPSKSYTHVKCEGLEQSLLNCSLKPNAVKCRADQRASAICYNTSVSDAQIDKFAVRLGNGTGTPYWGEVNVRHMGVWGQICSSEANWNDIAANIVCKQLKFTGGRAYGTVNETFMPVWITSLNCTGSETSLDQCVHGQWGRPIRLCKPAYALCYKNAVNVGLVGGGSYYGRVQINHDEHTGTICDDAWSTSDARVVCKQLGFADGDPVPGSKYGMGTGPVMMNGLGCYGHETSILQCRNKGWMAYNGTECSRHLKDASVICYTDVRLSRGNHSYGVVQIMDGGSWSVLCGEGFTETEAAIVCKQLGFQRGMALSMGSFGTFFGRYVRPNVSCTAAAKSILDCPYDEFRGCQKDSFLGYAVVSCYNGTLNQEQGMKLEGGANGFENISGRVSVKQHGIWGRVCPNDWDDNDATVVCRKMGYKGGVAYKYTSEASGPYTLGKVGCHGNESSLFDCPVSSDLCDAQFSSGDAGVLCYNKSKPDLKLAGSHNSGRLEVVRDGTVGTICNTGWSRYDASVACKQLGFMDGEVRSHFPSPRMTRVVMSSMGCYGSESTIFMCRNPGWRNKIDERCLEENSNAAVFCYNHVRISGGQSTENTTAGQVQMYRNGDWVTVCATNFDSEDAKVVCKELGYPNSKALVPGAFGRKYFSEYVVGFNCTGRESTIAGCPYETDGYCNDRSSNYASVLCSKGVVDATDIQVLKFNSFPATVIVEKHGMNGTICAEGWGDSDAHVLCTQLGYSGGVAFGPQYSGSNTPVWMTNVDCSGREGRIQNCKFDETPSADCLSSHMAARVFCYDGTGFELRLAGTSSESSGRVELSFNNQWGTICDSYWSDKDARVVCRQLGYLDGVAQSNSFYGAGTGPSWLYYVRCDGDEKTAWSCSNSGFNVSHTSCRNHRYDAGVYCTDRVRLEPNVTFGAVELWDTSEYRLICADGFNDIAAQVTCHTLGYKNGVSVCCSAFGKMNYKIGYKNIKCTGNELSVLDCKMESGVGNCPSKKYASVACSNVPSSGDYELRLEHGNRGRVEVRHFDIWGHVCTNNYDDNDAMVICREKGYLGGFSYYQYHYRNVFTEMPWLSNVNCSGSEGYLGRCGNIRWGEVQGCTINTDAAAYCYNIEGYKFRLVNGTSPMSGRVEMSIDGEWGTICGLSNFDDDAANVLCRQLNYSGGRALPMAHFGQGTGKIMVPLLRCKGNESSIFQCPIKIEPKDVSKFIGLEYRSSRYSYRYYSCWNHNMDAAVQCYESVRLVGTNDLNYGRLEMNLNNTWKAVCDTGFNDIAAKVVCRQLGYKDGKAQCCSALGDLDSKNISINNVRCHGSEDSLKNCSYTIGTCQSGKYVSVYCNETAIKTNDLKIRIAEGKYYGSLEVNRYGFWGPVCPVGWTNITAKAACLQLGYVGGVAFNGTSRLTTPIAVGRFDCKGARNLTQCRYKGFQDDLGCQYKIKGTYKRPTAGVLCFNNPDGVKFRIVGKKSRGKVEIKFNGEWGRVCNSSWQNNEAGVLCRQMGFIDGAAKKMTEKRGTGHVWINYVKCYGKEKSILECKNTWNPGSANCDDAGVVCYDSVRLSHGDKLSHGAVDVHINGNWGAVCNHKWDTTDADVTCVQLGFEHGLPLCCAPYGYVSALGFMDNVQCKGQEKKLLGCKNHVPHGYMCSMDYAAAACYNGSLPTSYSLGVSGGNNSTGSVDVTFLNITGRICADGWDSLDAQVVCREMGYARGENYTHYKWSTGRGPNAPFWTSNVNCTGKERTLGECQKTPFGQVKTCKSRHYAGVLCYQNEGVAFKLEGGKDNYGRVMMSVDGVWGSICNRYFDINDAIVMCRSVNFTAGFPIFSGDFGKGTGPIYEPNLHCRGRETSLRYCAHEGWAKVKDKDKSSCVDHKKDALVHCYNSVKLGSGVGKNISHGPVLYYDDKIWYAICDKDFTDASARVVCRDLGFLDGRAICCSAYGKIYESIYENKTLACKGDEKSPSECLVEKPCNKSNSYASVVCFNKTSLPIRDDEYNVTVKTIASGNYSGQVAVKHYGIEGRICSEFWDDDNARVVCRSLGYKKGIAYHHSDNDFAPILGRGPYWMGQVNCTGNEPSLLNCSFGDRTNLGDCSSRSSGSVICFNDNGLQYRLAGKNTKPNFGRVEISVNGTWGTVCDASWDNADASVLCRQLNFSDGYSIRKAHYGPGSGPIWLSHLQCKGTEPSLHKCPHRGFSSEVVDGSVGWWKCRSHIDDASVYCVDFLRLNQGYNSTMGAVQVYRNNEWKAVCDDDFDNADARVVCRTLGLGKDGKSIGGSAFGNLSTPIELTGVNCDGDEENFKQCNMKFSTECKSKMYASVYCSNESIVDTGFKVRLRPDNGRTDKSFHGFIEVKMHGIWGSVCMSGWSDTAANVACKQLGFKGGRSYRPPKNMTSPMMMDKIQCKGMETRLNDCGYEEWKVTRNCDYYDVRAGVMCYKKQDINYRINTGISDSPANRGRAEIRIDGVWGGICDWLWDSRDAKVFCRSLNYKDGLEIIGARYGHVDGPLWFTRVSCKGNESTIMQCRHSGFNSSDKMEGVYAGLCRTRSHDAAVECYNENLAITKVRLSRYNEIDVKDAASGRVEVYLSGANTWGTVCDDFWDDKDATVVCNQLGYAKGKGFKGAKYGRGSGAIWLDNVFCLGNESRLQDCKHNGYSVQNCNHGEDASVECSGTRVIPKPPGGEFGPQKLQSEENVAVAVTVPIIVILVTLLAIVGFIFWRRSQPKGEIKKALVNNDMNDPNAPVPAPTEGRVTLSKLKAHFSKPKSSANGGEIDVQGVNNPTYGRGKSPELGIDEIKIEQPTTTESNL